MNDKSVLDALHRRSSLILREIKSSSDDGNKKIIVTGNNIFIGSSKQNQRDENQDKVICVHIFNGLKKESLIAVIIADGMGGLSWGSSAASEAISYFISYLSMFFEKETPRACVEKAIFFSNDELYRSYKQKSGTTIAAAIFFRNSTLLVNVGDSRIYSCIDSKLEQLSIDDSFETVFNNNNTSADNDSIVEHLDNRLVQFVGLGPGLKPHIINFLPENNNNKFILTTDGIHYIRKSILERLIDHSKSDEDIVKRTILLSDWMGGHDNSTIAVFPQAMQFKDVEGISEELIIEMATNTKRSSILFEHVSIDKVSRKSLPKQAKSNRKNPKSSKKLADTQKEKANLLFEFKEEGSKEGSQNGQESA